ncbi:hypothetical protein SDC9_187091 [bioreactor metagenome]|uniref:Uncharacterized protein n=1 Tax=bioreactor metagenome TaxID=1076179 RepID=A0A645HW39_9ZZZZ
MYMLNQFIGSTHVNIPVDVQNRRESVSGFNVKRTFTFKRTEIQFIVSHEFIKHTEWFNRV